VAVLALNLALARIAVDQALEDIRIPIVLGASGATAVEQGLDSVERVVVDQWFMAEVLGDDPFPDGVPAHDPGMAEVDVEQDSSLRCLFQICRPV
jgi:hypothetical protein